jgi:DNA-binding beta-propeller fold protein YncE
MTLKLSGYIDLPEHVKPGGFDHAAVYRSRGRLYVAHTANDALDVIDVMSDQYLHSIPNLTGVAGALVSEDRDLVFTSNRGENSVSFFSPDEETKSSKVTVGIRPNGLSYDPARNLLLAANVGDPNQPGSFTVSIVDVDKQSLVANVPVPGRTRWTIFDAERDVFYVNIADPAQIVVIDAEHPLKIARSIEIPAAGPHGLDLDQDTGHLFCACDSKKLITIDVDSYQVIDQSDLSGPPDVIFFNPTLKHLYVASGDPGTIDVFDTSSLKIIETVATESGAHTIALDTDQNKVYVFLPETHRAAVYIDQS